jgi:hypothetical protein
MDKAGAVSATANKECGIGHSIDDAIDVRIDGARSRRDSLEH